MQKPAGLKTWFESVPIPLRMVCYLLLIEYTRAGRTKFGRMYRKLSIYCAYALIVVVCLTIFLAVNGIFDNEIAISVVTITTVVAAAIAIRYTFAFSLAFVLYCLLPLGLLASTVGAFVLVGIDIYSFLRAGEFSALYITDWQLIHNALADKSDWVGLKEIASSFLEFIPLWIFMLFGGIFGLACTLDELRDTDMMEAELERARQDVNTE